MLKAGHCTLCAQPAFDRDPPDQHIHTANVILACAVEVYMLSCDEMSWSTHSLLDCHVWQTPPHLAGTTVYG